MNDGVNRYLRLFSGSTEMHDDSAPICRYAIPHGGNVSVVVMEAAENELSDVESLGGGSNKNRNNNKKKNGRSFGK